jgi:hypothetical protein
MSVPQPALPPGIAKGAGIVLLKGAYKGLGAHVLRVNRLAGAWALEALVSFISTKPTAIVVVLTDTDQFKIAEENA